MPLWDFRRESTASAAGANTKAQIAAGYQPSLVAVDPRGGAGHAEKRNVIVTSAGWVRRENRRNSAGAVRTIEQILVAANPGVPNKDYSSNNYTGLPDISQIYVKLNANGNISANATNVNLYVVFNTPISFRPTGNLVTLTVANTAGGNHGKAVFSNTDSGRIVNANNTLVFRLPKLQAGAGSVAATYRVNAQSLVSTGGGNPLYNPDDGITKAANLVLTGAVSNAISRGDGRFLGTTFTVKRFG